MNRKRLDIFKNLIKEYPESEEVKNKFCEGIIVFLS